MQVESANHIRLMAGQVEARRKELEGLLLAAHAAAEEAELKLQREKVPSASSLVP